MDFFTDPPVDRFLTCRVLVYIRLGQYKDMCNGYNYIINKVGSVINSNF